MTQEEKQLLFKDLCARLPYCVKVKCASEILTLNVNWLKVFQYHLDEIKPYLRPMSSMTEEEKKDYWEGILGIEVEEIQDEYEIYDTIPSPVVCNGDGKYFWMENFYLNNTALVIDWLNSHHFDYRGLIPMGLALEAPDEMYK